MFYFYEAIMIYLLDPFAPLHFDLNLRLDSRNIKHQLYIIFNRFGGDTDERDMSTNETTDNGLLWSSHDLAVKKLARSAAFVALNNFEWRFITFVFYNTSFLYGVDLFAKTYAKSLIVGCGPFVPRFADLTKQYVLFSTDIPNLALMLEWMKKYQFDNTGKFIIICSSAQDCDETEVVKMLWNFKIVNVVYLKYGTASDETIAYTYFYKNYDCQNVLPVKLELRSCVDNEFCLEMFPLKLRNLHSCPIIVSSFTQTPYMKITDGVPSGADGDLLCLIAEKLNASLILMTPRRGFGWGKFEDDGTWSGSLGDVYYDLANFSMTSASITLSRFTNFQMSMDYNTVSVVWITHPSDLESPSLKLLRPFKLEVRIAILLSFLLVVLLHLLMKNTCWNSIFRAINVQRPRRSLVFYSWELCMGLPSTKLSKKSAFLYVILFWIWYCFLIRTFYTVFLIKSLKTSVYYSDLQNIDDAIAANYEIGGGPALKDYYIEEPIIYNRWINLESNEIFSMMINVSRGRKFVIGMNFETSKIFQKNHSLELHMLPQKIISSPTVIFFKKFSPLVASINAILTQLIESGFTSKLYKNYTTSIYTRRSAGTKKPINLINYTGCYAILFAGWMLSLLLFILELYLGRSRNSASICAA